jgi:hypothetical protein
MEGHQRPTMITMKCPNFLLHSIMLNQVSVGILKRKWFLVR